MKRIIYVTVALAAIFLSCKKDGDEVITPKVIKKYSNVDSNLNVAVNVEVKVDSLKEISRKDLYPADGYITGTVKAVTKNGTYFESTFKYELDMGMQTYSINSLGQYDIHLSKLDPTGSVKDTSRRTEMNFLLGKRKDSLEFLKDYYVSTFLKSENGNLAVQYNMYFNFPTTRPLMVFKNIVFNIAEGSFSADYFMDHSMFNDEATIEGKIKTKLVNVRYRTGS